MGSLTKCDSVRPQPVNTDKVSRREPKRNFLFCRRLRPSPSQFPVGPPLSRLFSNMVSPVIKACFTFELYRPQFYPYTGVAGGASVITSGGPRIYFNNDLLECNGSSKNRERRMWHVNSECENDFLMEQNCQFPIWWRFSIGFRVRHRPGL